VWLNAQTRTIAIGDRIREPGMADTVRIASLLERELGCAPLVLVVDDDEETRDGTEALLSSDGYCVEAARHEDDAVERASRCCPDLILVSLGRPPADVVATAVRIRRRAAIAAAVPVVVFSVPTIEEGAEVALGRNVYVTRPDNFDQLRSLIGRLIMASLLSSGRSE
jgi:CheY-like chemotaxis protein